ncbi:putative protein DOWNSTREAM OF FLC-like [Capsicum annuum]|nr:putative protein DOWNSTREAM OF FLC-like [Capsicum annuum]
MNTSGGKTIQLNMKGTMENTGDTQKTEQWTELPRHKTPDAMETSMMNKAESWHKGVQTLEKPSGSSCVEVISNPTIAAVERYIEMNWNYIAKPKVYYHNDGYFLVKFGSAEDRDKVMYEGPHMMDNKPIIIKAWEPEFDLSKKVLQTIPIWVKFPNLSLNCWGMQSLSRIGSGLGVPLYADLISYARVLVDMDITKDFP